MRALSYTASRSLMRARSRMTTDWRGTRNRINTGPRVMPGDGVIRRASLLAPISSPLPYQLRLALRVLDNRYLRYTGLLRARATRGQPRSRTVHVSGGAWQISKAVVVEPGAHLTAALHVFPDQEPGRLIEVVLK